MTFERKLAGIPMQKFNHPGDNIYFYQQVSNMLRIGEMAVFQQDFEIFRTIVSFIKISSDRIFFNN